MAEANGEATIKQVMEFFEMSTTDFMAQWKALDADSKQQLKAGIGNGSFNY